jgi:outer membrane immunogenic protein
MGDDMKISRILGTSIAALSLLAVSVAAQAADIPRPVYKGVRSVVAYYNWTGFYVGINGGYGWGTSDWTVPAVSTKPSGWLIGGTLGYNYQVGSWVLGLEGDWDWSDIKDSVACGAFSCETKNPWFGTVRGRIGYAFDRWLPYFTGGVAFGKVEASSTNPAAPGASDTRTGWTVGGGLEYAFLGNWSAKLEYLYVDLGSFDCSASCSGVAGVASNVDFKTNIIRAGLNYKFSGPIFSRY